MNIRNIALELLLSNGFTPEQIDEDMMADTEEVVYDRLITVILIALAENDKSIFMSLIDDEKLQDAIEYAKYKLDNYDTMIEKAVEEIKKEYNEW